MNGAGRYLSGAPVQAALIDLDGTLLDTLPDLARAARAMLSELGLADLQGEAIGSFVGKGVGNLVRRCLDASCATVPDYALHAAALESFERHYQRCNGDESLVYPGVREGLAAMRSDGIWLACVTNKAARFALPLLSRSGLAPFFDAVVTPERVARPKPHPEPYLEACRMLQTSPAESVVIGDSGIDGEAARGAGCRYLLVPYGFREGLALREIESDGIVATLLEAASLIRSKPNQDPE